MSYIIYFLLNFIFTRQHLTALSCGHFSSLLAIVIKKKIVFLEWLCMYLLLFLSRSDSFWDCLFWFWNWAGNFPYSKNQNLLLGVRSCNWSWQLVILTCFYSFFFIGAYKVLHQSCGSFKRSNLNAYIQIWMCTFSLLIWMHTFNLNLPGK